MSETYTITVTKEQARVIQHATELLARVMSGQWREILDWLPLDEKIDYGKFHDDVDEMTKILSQHMHKKIDGYRSSFGVGHPDIHRYHDISWDLCQVIRHKLSMVQAVEDGIIESEDSPRDWNKMLGVNYDPPMKWGAEPLAKMEKIDD